VLHGDLPGALSERRCVLVQLFACVGVRGVLDDQPGLGALAAPEDVRAVMGANYGARSVTRAVAAALPAGLTSLHRTL
jgi:hypothetical protein